MSLSFTIGVDSLPLPRADRPWDMEYVPYGTSTRTSNASYRVDHIANKWRLRVYWENLTSSERGACWTAYGGYIATQVDLTMPNGQVIPVMTALDSWQENQWYDPWLDEWRYDVSFAFEEV